MRVLVIGGTGLISTAIVDRLIETNHDVTLFNRGKSPSRSRTHVESIHGDRDDAKDFAAKMAKLRVDAVIDMVVFNPDAAKRAVEVFDGRVGHYLFCSTVCVYGGPLNTIPADEDEPHKPTGQYGHNKSLAERVFMEAYGQMDFPVTIFRPSHCYGPGRPLLDIFGYNAALVNRIREGRPILVPGDGTGLWQPGFTGDVAKGFVGALDHPETIGKAYNAVGDEIMDWRAFHTHMGNVIGRAPNIVPMTTAQVLAGVPGDGSRMLDEIFQYHAAYANTRLHNDVPEFTDLLPFEDGVRLTIQWMDETSAHAPSDSQGWIDALVDKEAAFRASLARRD